jgi:hypothetical protein
VNLAKHFKITDTEEFHLSDFPLLVKEVKDLKTNLGKSTMPDNDEIIISYLKDHMIRSKLALSHPVLVDILTTTGACPYLEDLFEASKDNKPFQRELEKYLKTELNA